MSLRNNDSTVNRFLWKTIYVYVVWLGLRFKYLSLDELDKGTLKWFFTKNNLIIFSDPNLMRSGENIFQVQSPAGVVHVGSIREMSEIILLLNCSATLTVTETNLFLLSARLCVMAGSWTSGVGGPGMERWSTICWLMRSMAILSISDRQNEEVALSETELTYLLSGPLGMITSANFFTNKSSE